MVQDLGVEPKLQPQCGSYFPELEYASTNTLLMELYWLIMRCRRPVGQLHYSEVSAQWPVPTPRRGKIHHYLVSPRRSIIALAHCAP
jgi:hypothetical protein